ERITSRSCLTRWCGVYGEARRAGSLRLLLWTTRRYSTLRSHTPGDDLSKDLLHPKLSPSSGCYARRSDARCDSTYLTARHRTTSLRPSSWLTTPWMGRFRWPF